MNAEPTGPGENAIEIFYSYAHEDEDLRKELEKHLVSLQRQGIIAAWHDRLISAGTEWEHEIDSHLNTAGIILLLISASFIASKYCYSIEMKRALERHETKEARVIPIILRPVYWKNMPFGKLQVLPTEGKPVDSSQWHNRDEAFANIVEGIHKVIEELTPVQTGNRESAKASTATQATQTTTPKPSQPAWNIPFERNPYFTGREDILTNLHDALNKDKTAALTQAISGLGGIGKTQTAIEYAYRHRDKYSYVFWVRSETREQLISNFVAIADLLNLSEKDAQDQGIIVDAVKMWLAANTGWLLILDNADDLAMAKEFIPPPGKGHVLLTTRAQIMGRLAQRVEIEEMELEEGALFLLRRANIIGPDAPIEKSSPRDVVKAKDIVQAVDGLPLALDQAAAYIEETECGLAGYLNRYQTQGTILLQHRGDLISDHPDPVATTWKLSFRKVEQANSAAADLLRLCSFLSPDAIPEEIITDGADDLGPDLQLVASEPVKLDSAIKELRKYSLVRRDPEAQTLTVHRLVQAVLKDEMNEETQHQWAERTVRAVNSAFPDVEYETWSECERLLPHARVCAELIEQWKMTFPEAARLLNRTGWYLRERIQYAEAEPLLQKSLALPEHPYLASSLNNLALLYQAQGKYGQAEPLLKRALVIDEKVYGTEHREVAADLNNLASLYFAQGKYGQAEPLLQRALAIWEKVLDPEHPDVATSLNNLALLYQAQGKYGQAESLLQRALAIWEKTLGPEHYFVAVNLNNLAMLYHDQGKYEQAELLFKRALAIDEKVYGFEHPDVAMDLENYAYLLRETNREDEATKLEERALAIRTRHAQENPTESE
jgi:tetratricopeptide (TPR) repeat protein